MNKCCSRHHHNAFSTELFRLTKRHTLAGKRTIVVKYARDNRYDTEMACTHDM